MATSIGGHVAVSEEVLIAAAENEGAGQAVMTLLLEQEESEIIITEEVMSAAARRWKGADEMMTLLLELGGDVMLEEDDPDEQN